MGTLLTRFPQGAIVMIRRIVSHILRTDQERTMANSSTPPDAEIIRRGDLAELRRHQPADREHFMRWYQDPDIAELLRHDLRPLTPAQAGGYFDSIVLPASSSGTAWAIYDRVSGNLLGTTAVTQIDRDKGFCLFRIVIGEKLAWGHGFGSDATRLVVEEVFETLGLNTIKLEVFEHNPRARRAYERVGFVETGRSVEWTRNHRLDVIAMELRRSDWEQSRDSAGHPAQ